MSLTVDKAKFAEQLAAVSSISHGRLAHPVLSYVKLEALQVKGSEGLVFLSATDLDQYYRRTLQAAVASDFSCLVHANMVKEWLAGVGNGELTVSSDGNRLTLKTGTHTIEIGAMQVKEFPAWPEFTEPVIANADLAPVSTIMSAAPDDDARLELFDVQICSSGENQLCARSAKGVVFAEHLFLGKSKEGHTLHITPPTIKHVSRLGPCYIADGQNFVSFAGDGFLFLSKKLAGKTLDFKANFNWKFEAQATLIREEFVEAVCSCHVLRGQHESALVTIEAEEGGLAIHTQNNIGHFQGFIAARVEGAFNRIILPSSQLLPPLRASTEDTVQLSITNPSRVARLGLGPTTVFIAACHDV